MGKTSSSNLKNVFVCRRLPTNKKLILCALCASAVIFLKGFFSVPICENLWLIAFDALRLCANRCLSDSLNTNSRENFNYVWLVFRLSFFLYLCSFIPDLKSKTVNLKSLLSTILAFPTHVAPDRQESGCCSLALY